MLMQIGEQPMLGFQRRMRWAERRMAELMQPPDRWPQTTVQGMMTTPYPCARAHRAEAAGDRGGAAGRGERGGAGGRRDARARAAAALAARRAGRRQAVPQACAEAFPSSHCLRRCHRLAQAPRTGVELERMLRSSCDDARVLLMKDALFALVGTCGLKDSSATSG